MILHSHSISRSIILLHWNIIINSIICFPCGNVVFFFGKSVTTLDKIFIFGRQGIKNAKLVVFQSWDHHAGHSKKRCWDYHFNIGNLVSHGFTGSRTKIVSMLLWFLSLTHCSSLFCFLTETFFSPGKCRGFPIRLENPHVISSNQLWAGVVSAGPSGCVLNSSYRNRDVPEYKQELGNAIGKWFAIW